MAKRSEMTVDAALAALAREAHDTMRDSGHGPGHTPGPDLMALVMADAALTTLAREAAEAAPRPGHDLIARVLADAAEIGAAAAPARATVAQPAPRRRARTGVAGARGGLMNLLFGWQAGAVATMGLALALGAGLGFEMDPGSLPILDANPQDTTPVTLASLETDLLDVDGL